GCRGRWSGHPARGNQAAGRKLPSKRRALAQRISPERGSRDPADGEEVTATVGAERTSVFPRFLDLAYPNIERGEGVWLFTTDGRKILDACSGGAMVSCLGHGVREVIDAAAAQANEIAYYYNHHFTNRPQEQLAERLVTAVAPE